MYQQSRPEEIDLSPAILGRSHSVQSDRPSVSNSISLVSPPLSISPEPAYIAATVASQLVNDNCDSQIFEDSEQTRTEPCREPAFVAAGALRLVNAFLDQLLYNFLSVARSTSLSPLRLAVSDVLKPKLAREAVAGADQELSEYLGNEGLSAFDSAQEVGGDWDLEYAFKRSRLRCMVFCRLGEMEEDEGTDYTKEQQLDGHSTMYPAAAEVSPAVAIFLASVLEYIGEQSLVTGGQAAYSRLHLSRSLTGSRNHTPSPNGNMDRVVVEELDMEKVALNSVLGRLWRTWRSRVRSPRQSRSRPLSPGAYQQNSRSASATSSRDHASVIKADRQQQERETSHPHSVAEVLNDDAAASVSLPIHENDIEEIEVPGLALLHSLEGQESNAGRNDDKRPKSMFLLPQRIVTFQTPSSSASHLPPNTDHFETDTAIHRSRKRSQSLPTAQATPLIAFSALASGDFHSRDASLGDGKSNNDNQTSTEQVREQVEEHKGLVASVIAGATALGLFGKAAIGSAAIAGVASAAAGEAPETKIYSRPPSHATTNGRPEFEEPQVAEPTRVSTEEIRGPRPVEVGRTRSRTTSTTRSSAAPDQAHAKIMEEQTSSSLARETNGEDDPAAIGVARTSNIPVAAMVVSPSREAFTDDGPNADESAWKEKRSSRFILAAPPTSRSQRSSATSTPPTEGVASSSSTLASSSEYRPSALDNGLLPLAPLREIRETGTETLNQGIPLARDDSSPKSTNRQDSESPATGHPPRTDSTSFSPSSHTPTSAHHFNCRRPSPTGQAWSSAEKASVHGNGVLDASAGSYSPITPNHGRSISLKRDKDDKESLRTRPSKDGNERVVTHVDQKQQSFERLIQGDQTLQYTLTPQNMRKIEAPQTQTADLAALRKTPAPSHEAKPRPSTSRSTKELNRNNSSRTNTSQEQSHIPASPQSPRHRPVVIPVRTKSDGPTPRLPTYEKESTKDFADFIRSTGPDSAADMVNKTQETLARPSTAFRYQQRPVSTPRSVSSPNFTEQGIDNVADEGKSTTSSKYLKRLQPREAQVSAPNSAELADFIRQGPPPGLDVTPKLLVPPLVEHSRAGNNPNNRLISPSSLRGSSLQTKSERSSSNSHTGLLENKSKMDGCQAGISDKAQKKLGLTEPAQPQRKQRRARDPYPIDTDSDDEDALEPMGKAKRNEESLMDFLSNVKPPTQSPASSPALADSQAVDFLASTGDRRETQKAQGMPKVGPRTLQKKQSGQGMGSRLGRNPASPKVALESYQSSAAKPTTNGVQNRSSSGAPQISLDRTGSSTLFSDLENFESAKGANNPSTFNPTPPVASSSPDQFRKENKARGLAAPVAVGPPIGSKRGNAGRSNDLIAFLDAGPPPGVTTPASPPVDIKEETGFRQMFGRMKKHKKVVA
ncbi:MAG: hypothetical protein M1835_007834 [Candelina submexicana]|nr:MAG: hypothetical protein M1835_007834 [Candelina submexicana]